MKYILILIFLAISNLISAQILNGEYRHQDEYLDIKDDSISFMLTQYCGLLTSIKGTGVFTISKDYIIVKTDNYKGEKSNSILKPNNDNKVDFQINDSNLNPIMGVNIVAYNNREKIVTGTCTNKNGIAHLDKSDNIDKIRISFIGYDEFEIKYSALSDYNISLLEGEIIENKTVIFQLIKTSEDQIKLMIIGTDFDSDKLDMKTLRQIKKYKKRNNCSTNELIKTIGNIL